MAKIVKQIDATAKNFKDKVKGLIKSDSSSSDSQAGHENFFEALRLLQLKADLREATMRLRNYQEAANDNENSSQRYKGYEEAWHAI